MSLEHVNDNELLAIVTQLSALDIPFGSALWNVCANNAPPEITQLLEAVTKVCLVIFVEGADANTCKVIVVSVTDSILIAVLWSGSELLG